MLVIHQESLHDARSTKYKKIVRMTFINITGTYADALFIINIAAFIYIPHNILQGYKDYLNIIISSITSHNTITITCL
jgi:hypothetical protein